MCPAALMASSPEKRLPHPRTLVHLTLKRLPHARWVVTVAAAQAGKPGGDNIAGAQDLVFGAAVWVRQRLDGHEAR
jgi:hypothetical protein